MIPNVNFMRMNEFAKMPTRASSGAAGYDLYAAYPEDQKIMILPGGRCKLHTGIAIELPPGYFASVKSRSGTSYKQELEIVGGSGTIDDDYRGEIIVPMRNVGKEPQEIVGGQRIAQLVIQKYETVNFVETDRLNESERGSGGFGSTGA